MANEVPTWLNFALQQMAAESYLDGINLQDPAAVIRRLVDGNNNGQVIPIDQFSGKTRFTDLQAQQFIQRYQIVDHHANDATGFSATLMFDTHTNSYTLSFRSTESATAAQGGDRERDLLGADAEIGFSGFAFGQLAAMEHYYQSLKTDGILPTGAVLNVTGFSLGGHLATVFTELHAADVNHAYIFNGAGRGHVPGAVPGLAAEENRISDMLTYFRSVLNNPDNAMASFSRDNPLYEAASTAHTAEPGWNPFEQVAVNIYGDARYQWAKAATQALFSPSGLTFLQSPGEVQDQGAFTKITHLYGQATTDDVQFIANSGVHAPAIPVFIEGQPLIAGLPFPSFTESGNTHSITLIVDSLAVQELIQTIDSRYGQASAELLIKASSNAKADTIASLNVSEVSEGDSLEKTVEAFRRLFLGPNTAFQPLPVDSTVGGFGNLAFRNEMYDAMAAIQQVVQAKHTQGIVFTIDDLTDPSVSIPVIVGIADTDTDQGLAYRYALKELNPFAIIADMSQANDALYQAHNDQGQLIRVNPADGTGTLTVQYLTDRALFLKEKITLNQHDLEKSFGNIHFKDVTPHGSGITTVIDLREDREFLFGSDNPDTLMGGSQADHLYGGGSVDVLIGNAGRDYLEGNGGSDRLEGGVGADIMVGGSGNDTYIVDNLGDQVIEVGDNGHDRVESSVTFSLVGTTVEDLTLTPSTGAGQINGTGNDLDNELTGNSGMNRLDGKAGTDHLIGNDGNDVLIGGTGDGDLLEGGRGFDTYFYNAGDGLDRIEDSDAQGQIIFNGERLLGGIHHSDDPLNTYKSLDGLTTYVLSGTDLIVNGVLIVNENFQSGQFGIQLRDVPEPNWENDYPVVIDTESDGFINNILNYSDIDDLGFGERGHDQLFGNGGNDILRGWSGNDRVYGGAGDDVLDGDWRLLVFNPSDPPFALGTDSYYGDDWVDGGDGNDTLFGSWGDDVLYGGTDNDLLYGDHGLEDRFTFTADDFLDGGEGDDELHGMAGDDVLYGGDGNDTLLGQEDDDWMDGGAGADVLWAGAGHDALSGGSGVDTLRGDLGNDLLDGGSDADVLYGGDGADELFGGAGGDLLFGDGLNTPEAIGVAGGNDVLDGGEGDDELQGMTGDDYLFGGAGHDLLLGQEGDDTLFGDAGNDQVGGGAGDDLLHGDAGDDVLDGHAGVDHLSGGDGNDGMAGGEGNDTLQGDAGNDTLQGDQGNDVLVGGAGHDIYNFSLGDGQDRITDTAVGPEGNVINFSGGITLESLTFVHDPLQQMLTIQVGGGGDSIRLLGFDPNTFQPVVETLRFSDGSVVSLADQLPLPGGLVEGTDEANFIRTGSSDDTVFAGAGNDVVHAEAGNDVLVGGSGADMLQGGAGQDRYVFNIGDGADTITDMTGEGNRLVFGAGLSPNDIRLGKGENSSLDVQLGLSSDRARLLSGLVPGEMPIEMFEFADGTALSFDQLIARGILIPGSPGVDLLTGTPYIDRITGEGDRDVLSGEEGADQISGGDGDDLLYGGDGNDTLSGDAGSDTLTGEAGDDLLAGGLGDDALYGGAGSDQYHYNPGDGLDTVLEIDPASDVDTVVFGDGIVSDDAWLSVIGGGLVVRMGSGQDGVRLGTVSLTDVLAPQGIDQFQFADGTVLTYGDLIARGIEIEGTPFDDALVGTNLGDRIVGGQGNDHLQGGAGDDTYYFNAGDGQDVIDDVTERLSNDEGSGGGEGGDGDGEGDEGEGEGDDDGGNGGTVTTETNRVMFGTGIAPEALTLDVRPSPFDSSESQLVVKLGTGSDELVFSAFDRDHALGPHAIAEFEFADGTILTYSELLNRGFDLTGTDQNDTMLGTNLTDRMDGLAGNDILRGGEGGDIYLFGRGSGQDVAIDRQGSADAVRFAADVLPTDVTVTRNGQDLVLGIAGTTDRLTLSFFFLAPMLQIEQAQFADGTVWDTTVLTALAEPTITGTAGMDNLIGTAGSDRLLGLGDADTITGLSGNDVLDGGTGVDQLTGGLGDDTYLVDDAGDVVTEAANEGMDTVQSAVSYQLLANVEDLTLTGTVAINGTGNELDNTLTGNSAANVLTGGTDNDTYVIGTGDTVVELAGEGTDTVRTSVSATLGANLENLTVTGSSPVTGTGNELNNVLRADGSISTLVGGAGNDTYVHGFNGDIDSLVETAFGGIDNVVAASDYRLPSHIENLTLLDAPLLDLTSFSLIPYGSMGSAGTGYGNELDNRLVGGRGNNVLDGGAGVDTLVGGRGDDTYIVDNPNDSVVEQAHEGTDTIRSSVSYTLGAHVENLTLIGVNPINASGNALNNDVRGNDAPNVLDGQAGNDSLLGFGGADTYLFGRGSGQDVLSDTSLAGEIEIIQLAADVALADVEVYRQDFNLVLVIAGTTDELTVASFFDQSIYAQKQVRFADGTVWNEADLRARAVGVGGTGAGTPDNDTLAGSAGHDILIGNAGDDILAGGLGGDTIYGDATTSLSPITGQPVTGNDILRGGPGSDLLLDFHGTNLFDAGSGNDSLFLGSGQDTVLFARGGGIDSVHFDGNGSDLDMIEMAADLTPSDVILTRQYPNSQVLDLTIRDTGDRLTINLSTNFPSVGGNTVQGRIVFSNGTQWDLTWSPAEPPVGSIGDDILQSSFPTTLTGMGGDDTYLIGGSGVPGTYTVIESSGGGIDTVQTLVPYTLDADVENLILAESRSTATPNLVRGVGNDLDNMIIGNTGDNILDGGAGNDVLMGGLFRSFEGGSVIVGTGSDILIGGAGDDVLMADGGNIAFPTVGFDGSWVFISGGGQFRETVPRLADDVFVGGTGNDTYIVHSQQQTVMEFANEGTDTVRSTVSYSLGEHVENLVLVDPVPIYDNDDNLAPPPPLNGTGNELDNMLIGSAEVNTLAGASGDDTLWGGNAVDPESGEPASGNDTLIGGAGHDTYLFNLGDGVDTIDDVAALGEGNRIQFGTGITRNDLAFTHDAAARTLTIHVGSSGVDALVLTNFDPMGANGSLVVESLAFADGSTAGLASLLGGPVNHEPTVANPLADHTTSEDAPFSFTVPADTFADQDVGETLVYSATLADGTALPTWLTFDAATRTLTGTPVNGDVGVLNLAIHATDSGGLSATDTFTLTVQNVNDAPTVVTSLADQSITQGSLFSFVVPMSTFADQDALYGDTVTYRATQADGTALPTWLIFDPSTRTLSGTPQGPDIGTLDVRVTATDAGALSAGDVFTLTILPITGTEENNTLIGTAGDDVMHGLAGDDVLQGLAGNDLLDGGPGIDAMTGGLGHDTYVVDVAGDVVTEASNQGTDTVQSSITYTLGANVEHLVLTGTGVINGSGNSLNNRLTGNSENNQLNGGAGADIMTGGQGNDTYVVDNVGDVVTELVNEGADIVQTGLTYTLGADLENLTLIGSAAINGTGNSVDNIIRGNSAANVLIGGAGNDTYVVGTGDTVIEQTNEGIDTVQTAVTWTLGTDVEHLTLTGAGTINGIGNSLNNTLTGNSAANTLNGDGGDDTLNGGAGADTLIGGTGNDIYIVDNVGDVAAEHFDEGIDLVRSSMSYTLSADVENLTLTGTRAINGTGNTLNNQLTGNSGANILDGAAGADILIGGTGNDTYVVDDAGDVVTETAAQGTDTVQSAITYALGTDVENLTLTGAAAINGTGTSLNNILTGNSAANSLTGLEGHDTLDGGVGADTLVGGLGNDIYVVDDADDVVTENLNEGTDLVQSSVSYALTANMEHLTLTGTSAIDGIGNALNNRLTGNSAANVLTGGAGNDIYVVSTGDTVIEQANGGTDTVQSQVSWTLGVNTEHLTLTGTAAIDATGNTVNNILTGNNAANQLAGGTGHDTLRGGLGDDTYLINRGEGQDVIVENDSIVGNNDRLRYGATINPLDLVVSRQVNDLRLAVHGSADQITIRDWYLSPNHHIETVQAGNGALLYSAQVDQLIQAMASFSQQSGLTWDQAIDQRPQEVQAILAASWQ